VSLRNDDNNDEVVMKLAKRACAGQWCAAQLPATTRALRRRGIPRALLASFGLASFGVAVLGGCSSEQPSAAELPVNAANDAGGDGTRVLPPSTTNQQKDGDETDVDCGGSKADACADSKRCATATDCLSASCTGSICQTATSSDGIKNGTESGVDCGGAAPNVLRCKDTYGCAVATDCISLVCAQRSCKTATNADRVKNGNESDIDCGGTNTGADKCDAKLKCSSNSDCKSDGCDYKNRCAESRSCTRRFGGDTCGSGEIGEPGALHESCCKTVALTNTTVRLDKYHVTAGRMRAFLTRAFGNNVIGNARAFADATPGWKAEWSPYVPSNTDEADKFLGPYWLDADNQNDKATKPVSKRSCNPRDFGGHTYWTPEGAGGDKSDYTQDELDPKALNCVGWHLAKAFCAWDGGRLPTRAEIANAFTNNSLSVYPWQFVSTPAYVAGAQDPRLNNYYNYGYPGTIPRSISALTGTVQDIAWYISPPGRFPGGANANGAQDMAGNLMHWTNDGEYKFAWTGTWEQHGGDASAGDWKASAAEAPNGYYGLGFRCAHD
jgi:formylglycine-generating enzyme required for sulfatase activity